MKLDGHTVLKRFYYSAVHVNTYEQLDGYLASNMIEGTLGLWGDHLGGVTMFRYAYAEQELDKPQAVR